MEREEEKNLGSEGVGVGGYRQTKSSSEKGDGGKRGLRGVKEGKEGRIKGKVGGEDVRW